MRLILAALLLVIVAYGGAAYRRAGISDPSQQSIAADPKTDAAGRAQSASVQEINDRFVKQVSEHIAGSEDEPAERVFKNIKWLKGVPAGQFLRIMDAGYSRALGVNCSYCHDTRDFSSDNQRPKRAAREMALMHRMINGQLRQMKNLDTKTNSADRAINCGTCHRGKINPLESGV